jgi:uncharacterized protein
VGGSPVFGCCGAYVGQGAALRVALMAMHGSDAPTSLVADRAGVSPSTRIAAIDALRGFALLGIVVAHMSEQYLGAPPPPTQPDFGVFSAVDRVAQALYGLLVIGKFFPIFSLLFGVSFVIQMRSISARGAAPEIRFLWRLAILFAIGMAHHLLYRGDILAIYAMLGVSLVFAQRLSGRALLVIAGALLVGLPRLLLAVGGSVTGQPLTLMPPADEMAPYYAAVMSGSPLDVALANVREGFTTKLAFQFGLFGRGYQTLALFLVGMWLARHDWQERLAERRDVLRRALGWSVALIVAAVVVLGGVLAAVGLPQSPDSITRLQMMVGLTLMDMVNLGIASVFVTSFLLLYGRPRLRRWLQPLVAVGRTALTVYLTQTLIGTSLLYGFGLGWLGRIGTATAILIAVAVFALQAVVATLWLRAFHYGPVEWVWRSLTFGRAAPWRVRA